MLIQLMYFLQETGFTKLIVLLATFTEGNIYLLVTVCIHKYLETSQQTTKKNFLMEENWPGGGGYFPKIWVGVCSALLETLTLFQTKLLWFSLPYFRPEPQIWYPISDQTLTLFRLRKHLRRASTFQR